MPRAKAPASAEEIAAPQIDPDKVDRLIAALERVADELRVVRQVLDETREEVTWALRNAEPFRADPLPIRPLTSMPVDPCAPDWAEQLNRLTPDDDAHEQAAAENRGRRGRRLPGITLDDYLCEPDVVTTSCFLDHLRRPVVLAPVGA